MFYVSLLGWLILGFLAYMSEDWLREDFKKGKYLSLFLTIIGGPLSFLSIWFCNTIYK